MGVLSLTYKRPSYSSPDLRRSQTSGTEKGSVNSGKSKHNSGIPENVTFDKVIASKTCPPLTLREFMNYLLYIERSAENLQFYLWHQDYVKRFSRAPAAETDLAPEWTKVMDDELAVRLQKQASEAMRRATPGASAIFEHADLEKGPAAESNPFFTPPPTATAASFSFGDGESTYTPSTQVSNASTYQSQASDAFSAAGAHTPFTIQPFREEINRIISTYIMDGAPRQINLSDRNRKAVMHALAYTTHPSALHVAFEAVDYSLRRQSHPNFVRWSVGNGNPARVSFARTQGFGGIAMGFIVAILVTLSRAARGWRAFAAVGWGLGLCAVIASYRGMCICMYSMPHHHHIRPWELFEDPEDPDGAQKRSFETFGSSNSFEHEPWIVKYEKQSVVKKIFDRERWIEEPALRAIQDTIFVQSMLIGLLTAGVLTAIVLPLPNGNFF